MIKINNLLERKPAALFLKITPEWIQAWIHMLRQQNNTLLVNLVHKVLTKAHPVAAAAVCILNSIDKLSNKEAMLIKFEQAFSQVSLAAASLELVEGLIAQLALNSYAHSEGEKAEKGLQCLISTGARKDVLHILVAAFRNPSPGKKTNNYRIAELLSKLPASVCTPDVIEVLLTAAETEFSENGRIGSMLVQLAKQSSTFRVEFILTVLQRNVIKLRSVQEWNSLSAADTARYLLTMSPDKPSQDEKGCSGLQEFLTVLISSVDKWQDLRLSNHRSFYWWFAELLNHLPDDVLCNFLKTANLKTEDQMQVLMGLNLENDFNIFLKLILNGFNIQLLPASFLKKAFLLGDRLLQLESTHNQSTALLIETVDEIQRIPLNKEQAKNVQKLLVQLIDVCKEEKYPAPKDWQECAIDLTPNSLPSDDSSMLMEEENPTCVLPEEKVIGKKRHKIIDQENSGNSLVSFYKKQKTDSKALEDEKSSVDEKALALEVKENKFSSGSTGLIGALMTQGQFKKPIVARAAKLKSRIQRGIIMNPGRCLGLSGPSLRVKSVYAAAD